MHSPSKVLYSHGRCDCLQHCSSTSPHHETSARETVLLHTTPARRTDYAHHGLRMHPKQSLRAFPVHGARIVQLGETFGTRHICVASHVVGDINENASATLQQLNGIHCRAQRSMSNVDIVCGPAPLDAPQSLITFADMSGTSDRQMRVC